MKRMIIVGSPRSNGRCAHLAEQLFEACIEDCPDDELYLVPVSELEIGPCVGCGGCAKQEEDAYPACIFDDDMQQLYELLPEMDELVVVSPVYFSGAPSSMKAVLDRMQPYFFAYETPERRAAGTLPPKRPATLHVVGEGGDPFGFAPLISEVKSSLACAAFKLERVLSWVGKISAEGEILEDAEEVGF